jgi:hypothetical protein
MVRDVTWKFIASSKIYLFPLSARVCSGDLNPAAAQQSGTANCSQQFVHLVVLISFLISMHQQS